MSLPEQPVSDDLAEQLARLRAAGAPQADALRWLHVQALARRAAAHQGAARAVIDARLAVLLAECEQALAAAAVAATASDGANVNSTRPMAQLLAHIETASGEAAWVGHAPPPSAGPGAAMPTPRSAPQDLKAVRAFRSTWSRLRLDQRLHQALATVPDQAGPLNTPRLLHQALSSMREASPEYLQHFMVHVESLLALEMLAQPAPEPGRPAGPAAAKPASRPAAPRPRGRAGVLPRR